VAFEDLLVALRDDQFGQLWREKAGEFRIQQRANASPPRASSWLHAERFGLQVSHPGTHALSPMP
jgi:hypothetical protein